jgi:hypothetical protein
MGTIDDIRKLLQDLVTPDLKAIHAQLKSIDESSKLRDDALTASIAHLEATSKLRDDALAVSITSKVEVILARMDAQHSTVMNALAIDKRLENLERQVKPAESATA